MASQEEINALQIHGKTLYRSAKYAEAVDAFSKAITKSLVPKASLFDNRAAAYEKLGDFNKALRDAQSTIRRHRKDVTGYLRAGRILQKLEKPEQALNIYQYGLGRLSISSSDDYKVLSSVCEKLSRHLSPPKSQDPFLVLPMEVAEIILNFLRFEQIAQSLRVSRAWNQLLSSKSRLWSHLDLSKAKRLVPTRFVQHVIQRSEGKLKRATLHRLGGSEGEAMRLVAKNCRNLDTLEILSSHILGHPFALLLKPRSPTLRDLVIGNAAEITLDCVFMILDTCKSLLRAEFGLVKVGGSPTVLKTSSPNLKVLKLVNSSNHSSFLVSMCTVLFPLVPNLEELTLRKWTASSRMGHMPFRSLPKLKSLDLLDSQISFTYNGLPPTLEKLRIDYTGHSPGEFFHHPDETVTSFPCLTELEWNIDSKAAHFLQRIAGCGEERSLDKLIIKDSALPSREILMLLENRRLNHRLKELSLSNSDFNDDTVGLVIERFTLLRRLDVSHTRITGVGVKKVVQNLKASLVHLAVNQCMELSIDAVEWAKKQGIQVDFRSQEHLTSARKVRPAY